ncbi:MAG: hypothetical protein IPM57_08330 [Oligoflexia bacterium]|nr:hypothetical protein [Oligoflexia bacterium]
MKNVLLTISLMFIANTAMAMPSVGDVVAHKMTVTVKMNATGETKTVELMSTMKITAYDAAKKEFTVEQTVMGEQVKSEVFQAGETDMPSDASIKDALEKCASYGGQNATVTISGKSFEVCKLKGAESELWVGAVPFSIVYANSTKKYPEGDMTTVVEATDFNLGK